MTDDSRSGGRDGSGARNNRGHRPGGSGGRRNGGGSSDRSRSDYGRGGGERGGNRGGTGGRGGRFRDGDRSGYRGGEGRRDDRSGYRSGEGRRDDRSESRGGEGRRDDRSGYRGGERRRGGSSGGDERGGRRDTQGQGRGERSFRSDDRRSGGRFDRDRRPNRPNRPHRDDRDRRDRRNEERDPRDIAPAIPEDVTIAQLDSEARRELGSLPRTLAEVVGRHLVMAGRLLDEDPELAYQHAVYARRKASRLGVVREAAGVAAYSVGNWQEALSDLRAARRMTGSNSFLAVMADCERGLGRPERALEISRSPEAEHLDDAERVELRIVAAGARRDLGEMEAALVELQIPELKERRARPYIARLFYAHADVLQELGRDAEAREYFARASAVDQEGVTDADERLAALEGVEIVDIDDGVVWTDAEDPAVEEDLVAEVDADSAPDSDAEATADPAAGAGSRDRSEEEAQAESETAPEADRGRENEAEGDSGQPPQPAQESDGGPTQDPSSSSPN
ncbi:hypothetical protein [Nocardiopsis rhodophaea]|uniref:hypothetical protein n=1 Tax=Nocardiopsis rhodophaea TaxID=280238 RepID=UPI0031E30C86